MKACEISRKGWGQPAFYNTEAIIQELLNAGKSIEDARKGGTSGCVETGAFGNEAYILTGYFNIPKVFELALFNGYDHRSGVQLGPETGYGYEFGSYDELWEAFCTQMRYFLDIKIRGSLVIEKIYAQEMPVPFLSVLTNDCICRGMDYNAGGARYNTSYVQGVGIGTITDSLAAVKYNVFDHCKFSMRELMDAMRSDFGGCGRILNQKFTPSVVAGEQGLVQMAHLIRTYFNLDGHHIQFNVIDRQTLLNAQQRPDEYKDLIVRVAGYSDHFRNLSKALQDEIIERTEHCEKIF